jgi:hypothetical protein
MERKIYIHPESGVKYHIDAYRFAYSLNRPPVFCIIFEVTIPRHERPNDRMRVSMEIKSILQYVDSQNPGLAKYLKSVLTDFRGKVNYEMLAFRSLEAEGFDMHRIVECIMNDAELTFREEE